MEIRSPLASLIGFFSYKSQKKYHISSGRAIEHVILTGHQTGAFIRNMLSNKYIHSNYSILIVFTKLPFRIHEDDSMSTPMFEASLDASLGMQRKETSKSCPLVIITSSSYPSSCIQNYRYTYADFDV